MHGETAKFIWSTVLEEIQVHQVANKFSCFFLNTSICYCAHKRLPLDPLLSQINLIHIHPAQFLRTIYYYFIFYVQILQVASLHEASG